jgi:hypothetical protein
MSKHETINDLAQAISAIRRTPSAPFEPDWAMHQFVSFGASTNFGSFATAARVFDPQLQCAANRALFVSIGTPDPSSREVHAAVEAYNLAALVHGPFVDVLAKANQRLVEQHRCRLPGQFLTGKERRGLVEQSKKRFADNGRQLDVCCLETEPGAGARVLAVLDGVSHSPKELRELSVYVSTGDPCDLLLTMMQLGLVMIGFPGAIQEVVFALDQSGQDLPVAGVRRVPAVQEAA